jgi:arylsulfatase A-like enzyme
MSFEPAALGRMAGAANDWIVRVPLFIKFPGQRAGRVEDAPVSHLDVFPTILAVLGLPPAPAAPGLALAGPLPASRPVPFTSVRPQRWRGTDDVVHYSVDIARGSYAKR